jgi:hypothetical protein
MRRLRDYQQVSVYVGETCVTPRVASVHGDEALLALTSPLAPEAGCLPAPAQLAFDHDGHLIMLTGMLYVEDANALRFVIADGVSQSDKRRYVRLAVRLDAEATPLDAGGADAGATVRCKTVDVSAGGTLLGCGGLFGPVRVAIELPGTAGTVEALGNVARSTATESGVRFTQVQPADQALLERFVMTIRRELARRFAAAAA